ncbi:MAG: DUF945 domain-containing protein [Acholeplasmataceae bacterium]|nr:DUF945 domain-containing protein [Acholeplasmataceae bacterium]
MKNLNLPALINQVEKEEQAKKDYLVDTRSMLVGTENSESYITIPAGRSRQSFRLNETARQQLASRLNVPLPYAERIRNEEPALYDRTLNTLLHRKDEQRLIRTNGDDTCRAYLSKNYKIMDHDMFLKSVLPILSLNPNLNLQEAFLSDTHLQLSITLEENDRHVRPGDPVKYGVVLLNSEVGLGSLSLSSFIYRLVCSNGLVVPERDGSLRRIHLGRAMADVNDNYNKSTWREYSNAIKELLTGKRFEEIMASMRAAAARPIVKDAEVIVEEIGKKFNLSKEEQAMVKAQYEANADMSVWGLINSVTEAAKEATTIQRRNELQIIGGKLLPQISTPSVMAA